MSRYKKTLAACLLVLSLLSAILALTVSFACVGREPVDFSVLPDPGNTVTAFFDAVCACEYEQAYALLDGCETLGLENTPEDEYAAIMWGLIRSNTSWEFIKCDVSGHSATARVKVICPDLTGAAEMLHEEINALILKYIDENPGDESIYGENGQYSTGFIFSIYDEAFRSRIENGTLDMKETEIEVTLNYNNDSWYIVPTTQLTGALTGGVQ